MKRYRENLSACCKIKSLSTICFQLYDILEKAEL